MKTRYSLPLFPALVAVLLTCLAVSCSEQVRDARQEVVLPAIYPDYVGVTIPVNIAPLNFCMADEEAVLVDAVIADAHGHQLHGQGSETTDFDLAAWRQLLADNVGDSLSVTVSAKYADGWHTYQPFSLYVSPDSIDHGIAYRLIEPGYEVWSKMGIYERNLSTFDERALIENTEFEGCVNCHAFNRADPRNLSLHIRGPHGATLLRLDGRMQAYNTATQQTLGTCVYPYWHPDGRYIAYSTNTTRQVSHVRHENRIEVFDAASDLQIYDTQTNELILSPLVKQDSVYETFPVFSADGQTLYFCSARAIAKGSNALDSIHYSLCSIAFDAEHGEWGNRVDTIIDCATCLDGELGSVSFPRPSYDGRWLVYAVARYGQFSIWHHEADLWMLDLQTGECRRMDEVNSDDTESFHNWSTNNRWMVFSSRRDDGLFTRPYFTHIGADGRGTKPFMLPQKSPRQFYRERFLSYNVPDFITEPVALDNVEAAQLIADEKRVPFGVRAQ